MIKQKTETKYIPKGVMEQYLGLEIVAIGKYLGTGLNVVCKMPQSRFAKEEEEEDEAETGRTDSEVPAVQHQPEGREDVQQDRG